MRHRLAAILGAWVLLLVPAWSSEARAEVYRWTDDEGTVGYASGRERVPAPYRDAAQLVPESPSVDQPPLTPAGPPISQITFTPGSPILLSARLGGAGPITLMLDTGADRTLVAPSALQALGIPLEAAGRARIQGVAGAAEAELWWIPSVEVEHLLSGPIRVVAHDAGLRGADGLLGRDFLDQFRVTIDAQLGIVTLAPLR